MKYRAIIADPPVPFAVWGKRPGGTDSRAAEAHYPTMTWNDLNALGPLVQGVAADDSVLFLWLCQPLLIETLEMAKAWGYCYKTKAFSWVKTYGAGRGFFVGLGYWTRANTEDVLLFTRGNPRRMAKDVYQVLATLQGDTPAVLAPMTRHSEKPEAIQDRIERLVDGPYLELFGRRARPGWQVLGNELDGLDIRESLARLATDETIAPVAKTRATQAPMFEDAA